jgi:hypothetical protein
MASIQSIYNHQRGHGCYECSLDDRKAVKCKIYTIVMIIKSCLIPKEDIEMQNTV